MKIILNNEAITLNGTTIADLIAQTRAAETVCRCRQYPVVAKGAYAETVLNENDKVDIVRPVVGG